MAGASSSAGIVVEVVVVVEVVLLVVLVVVVEVATSSCSRTGPTGAATWVLDPAAFAALTETWISRPRSSSTGEYRSEFSPTSRQSFSIPATQLLHANTKLVGSKSQVPRLTVSSPPTTGSPDICGDSDARLGTHDAPSNNTQNTPTHRRMCITLPFPRITSTGN